MHDRVQAAALFRREVGGEKLIEGWIEGPMAEGADLRGINTLMLDFYDDPAFVADLFEFVIEMGIRFARAQVEAGVDLIGVGRRRGLAGRAADLRAVRLALREAAGGRHPRDGREGAPAHLRQHQRHRRRDGPARLRHRGPGLSGGPGPGAGADAGPGDPRQRRARGRAAQRHAGAVTAALAECHRAAGPRYIVGAGCEVPRDTPEANVRAMCRFARDTRP